MTKKLIPDPEHVDLKITLSTADGRQLNWELPWPKDGQPQKPNTWFIGQDGPHRIGIQVPNWTDQDPPQPSPIRATVDHATGLVLLAQLAISLAIVTPTNQEPNSAQN